MPTSKSSIDHRDIYYRLGKSSGYRARSAFKLLHLDEEFDLFEGVETAVDLCAAPGSWSQVLGEKLESKLREGKAKVVSLDLQPMAPLKNITILQTDITLPATIPLVLNALGRRKADLVVCDGAPDVTGVHDLDAYLHSQLLAAALTLSLTLLAPHATLIFKIFLSPLDPQAEMLRAQVEPFFQAPTSEAGSDVFAHDSDANSEARRGKQGFDLQRRRGGVWVRKPRSSRQGSSGELFPEMEDLTLTQTEAFLVCRNFDPSKVPLPETFSSESLAELAKQTKGTLTLDSLAHLSPETQPVNRMWGVLRAWVGSGDLNPMIDQSPPDNGGCLTAETKGSAFDSTVELPVTSSNVLYSSPSSMLPAKSPSNGINPSNDLSASPPSPTIFISPARLHLSPPSRLSNPTLRALNARRDGSVDSSSPPSSASPTSLGIDRPWDRRAPSPLPSPISLHPPAPLPAIASSSRCDFHTASHAADVAFGGRKADEIISSTPTADGAVSPALSASSKTDIFFATSQIDDLPRPPKALPASALGRGWPGQREEKERSATMPSTPSDPQTTFEATPNGQAGPNRNSIFDIVPSYRPEGSRSLSGSGLSAPTHARQSSVPVVTPTSPLAKLSSVPSVLTPERPRNHVRRESQIPREHRIAPVEVELKVGDMLEAERTLLNEGVLMRATEVRWRLEKRLGEGAFSAVWSASGVDAFGRVCAVKLTSRALCLTNDRTRISFLREVSVLRRLSHPNVVSYVTSFSTRSHHCLMLEALTGGELFELVADDSNRRRMMLPSPSEAVWEGVKDPKGEGFVRRVFGELARGVGWLHTVGVVHRDIKLENILLTVNPFSLPPTPTGSIPLHLLPLPNRPLIKLTDFGLSRFINPTLPLLTTRCGSESFAGPEIIMGRPYDGRDTDSWACGVVLYALITGELPFDEPTSPATNGKSPAQKQAREEKERRRRMMRIAKGNFTWPEGVGSDEVRRVVGRLLVRDPKKRTRVSNIWEEQWMEGPGGGHSNESDGVVTTEGGRKGGRRVGDGWLGDEDPEDAGLYGEAD